MRANLPTREPEFQQFWEDQDVYRHSVERNAPRGLFVLHDGPPYSNGDIHTGHAMNKILKDIITRHRTMQGFRAPYVPGWDNHGMPIEYAVSQSAREAGETLTRVELRARCREYAARWVEVQKQQFRRLGVRGDWDHPYLTMDPEFEARIVEVFAELATAGFVYRGLKPILWCPYDETALAEAEVEYEEKTSPSIYVRFPLDPGSADPRPVGRRDRPLYTVIWTTTPWTIPANLAVAFHPELEYSVARTADADYLLAEGLREAALSACGLAENTVVHRCTGEALAGTVFRHPLHELDAVFDRASPAVLADYVTLEQGSGVVHTAPGHGEEDFRTGQKYGLEVLNPVDGSGRFTSEAGPFVGKAIRSGEADRAVLDALADSGNLLHREPYRHNYPHCWRCHGPLIFRATVQWFMQIDHVMEDGSTQRERMLSAIRGVKWFPPESVARIESMAGGRPDWCLSRQRAWGVGIPIFYCKPCGHPIHTPESLAAAVRLVREEGADAWFSTPADSILPAGFACPHCAGTGPYSKETDVLDVWFDSGSTWSAVLEQRPELAFPADVYIEGSDQHRGWFNSSLTLATALRGTAPYRTVISHGFVMDPHGEKMSKSKGNFVSPLEEIEAGGADLLRFWVASTGYFDDVRIGREIMDQVRNVFLRVRNTFRFLVGNLADFDPQRDAVPYEQLGSLDRWALHRLTCVLRACEESFERYEYKQLSHEIPYLCTADLGSFYLDVIKDRLYCGRADSSERRAAQTVLYELVEQLTRLMAPILVHVSEEVWQAVPGARERHASVHLAPFPVPEEGWLDEGLAVEWERLRSVRDRVNAAIELLKPKAKNDPNFVLKSSLEAEVRLSAGPDWLPLLSKHEAMLATIFMVPVVTLTGTPTDGVQVEVVRRAGPRCERCWLVLPDVGQSAAFPDLCGRCAGVVESLDNQTP